MCSFCPQCTLPFPLEQLKTSSYDTQLSLGAFHLFLSPLGASVCHASSSQEKISAFISCYALDATGHSIPLQSATYELATYRSPRLGLSALCNTSITSLCRHWGSLTSLCVVCLAGRAVTDSGLGGAFHLGGIFHIHDSQRAAGAGVSGYSSTTGGLQTPHLRVFCPQGQRAAGS